MRAYGLWNVICGGLLRRIGECGAGGVGCGHRIRVRLRCRRRDV
jgi:hypothetical protein